MSVSDEVVLVTLTLTRAEAIALASCADGELESLSEQDWGTGLHDRLAAAQRKVWRTLRSADAARSPGANQ